MITIDGSEGGGQLLRTSLTLSVVTGKAFNINNIRGKRQQAGLKPQHLTAVKAMQTMSDATVEGATVGSTSITFAPKTIKGDAYTFNIGTAGSTLLLLQTLLPALLHAKQPSTLTLQGGTDTAWCPGSMYIKYVFCDFLKRMGVQHTFSIEKYGFHPKGGGRITFELAPLKEFKTTTFTDRGKQGKIGVHCSASRKLEKRNVAERLLQSFKDNFKDSIITSMQYVDTLSDGCFIHSHVHYGTYTVGTDVLGEKKKTAEAIGKSCAENTTALMQTQGVDRWAADQLMVYLALQSTGEITINGLTNHIKTNARVIEQFLPVRFVLQDDSISCQKT